LDDDAVNHAGELIVACLVIFGDRRSFVAADVRAFIGRKDATLGMLDPSFGDLLAIDEDRASYTSGAH
jgi:hypothetical protein